MADSNADPLSHDHYKNLGKWCPLKADGTTLSLLANSLWSLERSLHDEWQLFCVNTVILVGMTDEPVEVKSLQLLQEHEPDRCRGYRRK